MSPAAPSRLPLLAGVLLVAALIAWAAVAVTLRQPEVPALTLTPTNVTVPAPTKS